MDKLTDINAMITHSQTLIVMCKRKVGLISGWRKDKRACKTYIEMLEKSLYHLENLIKEYNQ